MAWSLVCPANRGIGFHLTRHLLRETRIPVVATTRRDVEGVKKSILSDLPDVDSDRLTVMEIDVTDESTISKAASQVKSLFPPSTHHLRLAFCIPGILYPEKSPSQLNQEQILSTFAVNTVGPLLLTKHFSPFLPKKSLDLSEQTPDATSLPRNHAVWLNMSARVGSTSDNALGGWYSYRASKAGVNSLTKTFDLFLKTRAADKAMAIAYHPGTVKTGLSEEFWGNVKKEKLFEPGFAVEKMLRVVNGVGIEGRGRCWDWKGEEILP
ncbi:short-chain dehydrogenase protein [Coleophoma cylindrospora]|uniref:Short-chain dehydrogenase protein n=1 Tax=Coleophoma cylindrospora TaxID=1849047 RepID=A0A3D8S1N9_9HELO|nr:short-chain dehydrogenase protein [Coleophoma cylindrospora]